MFDGFMNINLKTLWNSRTKSSIYSTGQAEMACGEIFHAGYFIRWTE